MGSTRNLPLMVRSKFKSAQEAGDLTFYATQVSILQCSGVPFQLRFSSALANKPKANKLPNSKLIDVFENPRKLLISEWPPSHNLVLNKFAINANHFILATKDYKEQTHLLEEGDLSATYECIEAYRERGEDLFAFFNSGEFSGASQPHRHIQFLPVESMQQGIAAEDNWFLLADQLLKEPKPGLPFSYFSSPLPSSPTPRQLHELYIALYHQAIERSRVLATEKCKVMPVHPPEEATISYNLAITKRVMVLCPRQAEGIKVTGVNGDQIGPIALNGTLLGGTLLVKNEEEWNTLRGDNSKLNDILQAIGIQADSSGTVERL